MHPTFTMSPDTRLLRERLRAVAIGDVISYDALSVIIGKKVDGTSPFLRSAINSLLRQDHIVFAAVRGVGVKRLDNSDIVRSADNDVDGIRRKARRAALKITSISDYEMLSAKEKLAHTSRLSIFTAIAWMTTDSSVKKLESVSDGVRRELPLVETLKAFM